MWRLEVSINDFPLTCQRVKNQSYQVITVRPRTAARKFSIGGLCVSAEGHDILKIDKNSPDLQCVMFQFGSAWSFAGPTCTGCAMCIVSKCFNFYLMVFPLSYGKFEIIQVQR